MQQPSGSTESELNEHPTPELMMSIGEGNNRTTSAKGMGKRAGKRPGRKPSKIDERAKLERSRQSARECRARKKLRYQYLEELVLNREKAVFALRDELETYKQWCFSVEHGGQTPESLLKMLARDEAAVKRKQAEQAKRTQLPHHSQFPSSSVSSASPVISPAPQMDQSNLQLPRIQELPHKSSHNSILLNFLQDGSSVLNHQQHASPGSHEARETQRSTPLQRQLAFDHSHLQDRLPRLPQLNLTNQLRTTQQQPMLPHSQPRINNSIHQKAFSFPQSNTLPSRPFNNQDFNNRFPQISNHQHLEEFNTLPQDNNSFLNGVTQRGAAEPPRRRSVSNPPSMTSHFKPTIRMPSNHDLPSSLQDFITSHNSSGTITDEQGPFTGLFTGTLIGGSPISSSSGIPTSITIEDSSNESMGETYLNQSSRNQILPVHRSTSNANGNHTGSSIFTNNASLNPMTSNFDLKFKNINQSNSTNITSSPSWCGLTTTCVQTPSGNNFSYSGVSASNAQSSSTPTPLSSLSSILELFATSPGLTSTAFDVNSPATSSQHNPPQPISAGINSFIHDPVPDWYSFLDDLQDGNTSSLTPRHVTSSNQLNHNLPMALTSSLQGQHMTPSSSFMNVPNIIDEIMDTNDQIL